MRWIAENTEEGAIVFHKRWPQFCLMFYFDHRNRYIVGLDPYFLYQHDPDEYVRWIRISEGVLDPEATRDGILAFDARFVLVKRGRALDLLLRRAADTLPRYQDPIFRIYEISPR